MSTAYSIYEAKARFSEVMRKVRGGQRVVVTYHGEPVAEIIPVGPTAKVCVAAPRGLHPPVIDTRFRRLQDLHGGRPQTRRPPPFPR